MAPEFLSGAGTFANPLLSDTKAQERSELRTNIDVQPDVRALNSLAVRSLVSLFNEKEQLFSQRIVPGENGLLNDSTSRKRTILALLGLHRLAESGARIPFDLDAISEAVFRDHSWVKKAGDLGLLTWFVATCCPDRLEALDAQFDFENALTAYPDGRQARTTGVSWFLAGLSHARQVRPQSVPDLTDVAVDAYRILKDNQSDAGMFGHAALPGFPRETLFRRLGTFSDQIYAIYALSMFARAFEVEEPLEDALSCANEVCSLQGELGEWWFLYDTKAARVVTRYPVCSVHQDGTAPCGLMALEESSSQSFRRSIFKGLAWIGGANELADDLCDSERALIWDSIGPRRQLTRYWDSALGLVRANRKIEPAKLEIRREMRPDHFGWLLYAFGRHGLADAKALAAGQGK